MSNSLIEVKDLKVYFKQKSPKLLSFKPGILKAVDQVSFSIEKGKTFGLVGESGSGKSTIGKAILRYHKPTGGEIFYGGTEIGAMGEKELLPYRKKMQSVFQDPYSSLDPSHTVQDIICEPMEIHKLYTPKERKERAKELAKERKRQQQAQKPVSSQNNKFNNFDGRSYDMNDLERRLVQQ